MIKTTNQLLRQEHYVAPAFECLGMDNSKVLCDSYGALGAAGSEMDYYGGFEEEQY